MKKKVAVVSLGDCRLEFYNTRKYIADEENERLVKKLKEFYEPAESKTITITQAFYHATKEAGSVFGKVGSFEKGYAFNALVIDNMEDSWSKMTAQEKLERFCYIGDDRNIKARYIDGKLLSQEF